MIVNVWTISSLFLALVGALLAVLAAVTAVRALGAVRRRSDGARTPEALEDRTHLVTLFVTVLALVRLIAWPHFYLLLESYVPELAPFGAMCTFGVTRIDAHLVGALQLGKPILVLGLGFWVALGWVDQRAAAPVLAPTRLALTLPLAALALAECTAEIVYLAREKVGEPVTCCTQFVDTEAARVYQNSGPLSLAFGASPVLNAALYVALNLAVIACAYLMSRRGLPARRYRATLTTGALALAGLLALLSTGSAWIDWVAPRVLRLPYHHCIYELLTDTLAFGFAALASIIGSGMLTWVAALQWLQPRAPGPVAELQRGLLRLAAIALATSLLIVLVHLP